MCSVAIRLQDLMPMPAAVVAPVRDGDRVIDFEIIDTNPAADLVYLAGRQRSAVGHRLRALMPWIEDVGVWRLYHDALTSQAPVTYRDFDLHYPGQPSPTTWDITTMPLGDNVLVFFTDVTDDWSRYREREERTAAERVSVERTRMARDLHDTVIQDVIGASMAFARLATIVNPAIAEQLSAIIDIHDDVVRHLRGVLFDLRSRQRRDLRAEIDEVIDAAAVALGFPPCVRMGPLDAVCDGAVVGDHLVSMLRETLSNVARHAHAHHVLVEIREADGWLTLDVTDDGVSIDPAAPRGSGLANLDERTRLLGGMSFVDTPPTGGTRVVCELPVGAATVAQAV